MSVSRASATPEELAWEAAYERFETPAQEVRKFERRLVAVGARHWPKDTAIVEIFCGRGNGMRALEALGFGNVIGVDLSLRLLRRYDGGAALQCADCRRLPLANTARDLAIVHGGLHHLPELPGDLERTLAEVHRVLRPGGRLIAVEPWRTPFLDLVHFVSELPPVRRAWGRMDAFATMTDYERVTYEAWLGMPERLLAVFDRFFEREQVKIDFGKLRYVGRRRATPAPSAA